jgi:hypothetical protein
LLIFKKKYPSQVCMMYTKHSSYTNHDQHETAERNSARYTRDHTPVIIIMAAAGPVAAVYVAAVVLGLSFQGQHSILLLHWWCSEFVTCHLLFLPDALLMLYDLLEEYLWC